MALDDIAPDSPRDALLAEIEQLRRALLLVTSEENPNQVHLLEEQLMEAKGQLTQSRANNEKLTFTIQQTRDQLATLREEVERLSQPPNVYGFFHGVNPDGTVDVVVSGRKMRVALSPSLDPHQLKRGDEVALNESYAIIEVRDGDGMGDVVSVKEVLDRRRALIYGRGDDERVAELSTALENETLRAGDAVLYDSPGKKLMISFSKKCRTSPTATSVDSMHKSKPSRMPSNCRISIGLCSATTSYRRQRAFCFMGLRDVERPSSPRQSLTRWLAKSPR